MKNQMLLQVQPNSNRDQDSQTQNYFIDSTDRKAESTRIDNETFNTIQDAGKQVIVHSVIAGGLAQDNTVSDFVTPTSQLPVGVQVVVWLNEHFGPIESEGKFFEEMRAYLDNKHRVTGIVRLPKRTDNTYGKDIATMLKRRLTFDEALKSDTFQLMSKQRIKIVQRSIYEQLAIAI